MNFVDLEIPFDEAENYFKPNNKAKLNKLFYKDRNYEKLLEDTTYYLIGEKGSGKTTYCAYFCNNTFANIRSKRYAIGVDDYNKIIQMKKEGKLNYTHYLTLWKAILLTKLLATIDDDELSFFNGGALEKIRSTLKEYNFTKITMDTFSPVSMMDNAKFSSEINGELSTTKAKTGGKLSEEAATQYTVQKQVYEDNWQRFINQIAADLEKLRLKNHHYLFIDGIDTRPQDITYDEYKECIYPLVRAVYDINCDILSKVKERNKGRLQIILLTRLDIFLNAGLSNAGSKICDNSAFLNWSMSSEAEYRNTALFALVNNMIQSGNPGCEPVSWESYFNYKISRGSREFSSFPYFLRLSTSKPRDFVKLLKIAKEQCLSGNKKNPDSKIIGSDLFQRAYSTYYADSLRTALGFYYSEKQIKLFFDFIKSIKRCKFTYEQYEKAWDAFSDKDALQKNFGDSFALLELMFNFNLIALKEDDAYYRWKYRECSIANYDYGIEKSALEKESKFVFHWAAEKEFGLYLR